MKNNENLNMCKSCGKCCNHMAGTLFPEDIKETITKEVLLKYLEKDYCLDSWVGNASEDPKYDDITFYFIRPRHTNAKEYLLDESYGGICVLLTETGCSLTFENRPSQCKALIPKDSIEKHCITKDETYSKKNGAIAWLPYNSIFLEILNEYEGETLNSVENLLNFLTNQKINI